MQAISQYFYLALYHAAQNDLFMDDTLVYVV